jgi:hypothetical protein
VDGQPFMSRSMSEVRSVRVDAFFLKYGLLNLATSHDPKASHQPTITFGPTEITGLKMGGKELKITLDTASLNKYPTFSTFEAAHEAGKLPKTISRSFVREGRLLKNASNYLVGSIVSKIEGLPEGITPEEDGYTITWPGFGKLILGEIIVGPYVRRVTLVRLKHSDTEIASGCSGGSSYP